MEYGEIITLGRHRLMCGDATNARDIDALLGGETVNLVLTDPPYGMKCQNKDGKVGGSSHWVHLPHDKPKVLAGKSYPMMIGDDSQETARLHWELVKGLTTRHIWWGASYFANFLPISPARIFWNKRTGNNDFSDGELAYVSWGKKIKMYTQLWNGVCMGGSYLLNNRVAGRARCHPTQKPVELHKRILEDYSKSDDVILDCFGGSGTTLIAAELTGRKCLMMELSPEYCDVIRERFDRVRREYPLYVGG